MFILKITDTETGEIEQATVKGLQVLEGHYTPPREGAYTPSVSMADTTDLLHQLLYPSKIKALFDEASAPRWTLAIEHI